MITVCIATYNGVHELRRQLDSILPQLGAGDEVIISDDRSTDGTREMIAQYRSPLIRLIDGPAQGSPVPNFENALRHAQGDYIFLSDQDDQWLPNKVEVMVQALQSAACVVSDCYVTDEHLTVKHPSFFALNHTRPGWLYNLFVKNGYLGCCMAFRRSVLERALPFPKRTPMHDIWIGNIAAMYFDVKFIPERLIHFCRHDHNASDTARKSTASFLEKLKFRWVVLCGLVQTCCRKRAVVAASK